MIHRIKRPITCLSYLRAAATRVFSKTYNWPFLQDHVIHARWDEIGVGWPKVADDMQAELKKTVVMVGMMGAGKTAVGRTVAQALNVRFLDSDAEIETAANMSVADIFARDGEPFFRQKETQVITRLLDEERGILSTGGGAFMNPINREIISKRGVSVWLNADLDLLWDRVRHRDTRPLLQVDDPFAVLSDLYRRRVPVYALADLEVAADPAYALEDMADRVIETLQTRPDVLEIN